MSFKILIVEDETATRERIQEVLRRHVGGEQKWELELDAAADGTSAMKFLSQQSYDLVLLDIVLPDIDGFEISETLRSSEIPFFMISSRDLPSDAVRGFEAGAEDYIRKPVDSRELAVRVAHFLGRAKQSVSNNLKIFKNGELHIDFDRRMVLRQGQEVELTPIELKILLLLARNAGRYIRTERIIQEIWQDNPPFDGPKALRVHVRRLRAKIEEKSSSPRYILNRWGAGYMLQAD